MTQQPLALCPFCSDAMTVYVGLPSEGGTRDGMVTHKYQGAPSCILSNMYFTPEAWNRRVPPPSQGITGDGATLIRILESDDASAIVPGTGRAMGFAQMLRRLSRPVEDGEVEEAMDRMYYDAIEGEDQSLVADWQIVSRALRALRLELATLKQSQPKVWTAETIGDAPQSNGALYSIFDDIGQVWGRPRPCSPAGTA